jgi:hypothetical protein
MCLDSQEKTAFLYTQMTDHWITWLCFQIACAQNFDKTETSLAAVELERKEKTILPYCVCRARITGSPHGLKNLA